MIFKNYFYNWYQTYRSNIAAVTKAKYENYHQFISGSEIGGIEMKKITRKHAQQLINDYGKSRSKTTVLDFRSCIRGCFKDAVSDGDIKINPFSNVELVYKEQMLDVYEQKKLREKKKWLEIDEYERFKIFLVNWLNVYLDKPKLTFNKGRHIETVTAPAQYTTMQIFIALKTGARFSEILGLTESDIDFDKQTLNVDKTWDYKKSTGFLPTKNISSIRKIEVDEETIAILKRMLIWVKKYDPEKKPGEPLLIAMGHRSYAATTNGLLKRFLSTCGIEYISMHKLRHTQASYLLAKGISIQVVAKRLGHTDTHMVQTTYGHLLRSVEVEENSKILTLL